MIPRGGGGMVRLRRGWDGVPEPEDESLLRWLCSRRIFKDIWGQVGDNTDECTGAGGEQEADATDDAAVLPEPESLPLPGVPRDSFDDILEELDVPRTRLRGIRVSPDVEVSERKSSGALDTSSSLPTSLNAVPGKY